MGRASWPFLGADCRLSSLGAPMATWMRMGARLLLLLAATVPCARGQGYSIVDLGPPGLLAYGAAYGVDASGRVVGAVQSPFFTPPRAFLYRAGALTDLGTLGGTSSTAYGINALGQAVGESRIAGDLQSHAFIYDEENGMLDLIPLGRDSRASAINSSGQIAGYMS